MCLSREFRLSLFVSVVADEGLSSLVDRPRAPSCCESNRMVLAAFRRKWELDLWTVC
jgi:hypothetical protein